MAIKSYLFVCSAGRHRSPAGVEEALKLAREKGIRISAKSYSAESELPYEISLRVNEFDRVFVMENWMVDEMKKVYAVPKEKIRCFNIPDEYRKDDPKLRKILRKKLEKEI